MDRAGREIGRDRAFSPDPANSQTMLGDQPRPDNIAGLQTESTVNALTASLLRGCHGPADQGTITLISRSRVASPRKDRGCGCTGMPEESYFRLTLSTGLRLNNHTPRAINGIFQHCQVACIDPYQHGIAKLIKFIRASLRPHFSDG